MTQLSDTSYIFATDARITGKQFTLLKEFVPELEFKARVAIAIIVADIVASLLFEVRAT